MYEQLEDAADKWLVLDWRELGYDWVTSITRSGVLTSGGARITPRQAARADYEQGYQQLLLDRQRRLTDMGQHRETAEHEAAHAIVAQALGLRVVRTHISPKDDGTGGCTYTQGTPYQTAVVALAGEIWIGVLRSLEYIGGARGCQDDRRAAVRALPDHVEYERAYRQCFSILRENHDLVLAYADRLERDGECRP